MVCNIICKSQLEELFSDHVYAVSKRLVELRALCRPQSVSSRGDKNGGIRTDRYTTGKSNILRL